MNEFKYYKAFQLLNMHVSDSATTLSALVLHTSIIWRLSPRCMPIVLTILILLEAVGITLEMLKDLHFGGEKNHYKDKMQKLTEYYLSLISEHHIAVMKPGNMM